MANEIPNQFFFEMDSLKRNSPTRVETITIATLFTVNSIELSNPSNCKALNKKKME